MEDLIPLLIFIVIAIINFLKYAAEKGGKKAPKRPEEKPARPKTEPNTLEEFFDDIARKFGPQPHELAEWPEGVARPDYVHEMEEFETAKTPSPAAVRTEEPVQETASLPFVKPVPGARAVARHRGMGRSPTFKLKAQETTIAGMSGSHIPVPPMLRSATGRTRFELRKRKQLKRALIASMVFGQPRAYDQSFHNTIAN